MPDTPADTLRAAAARIREHTIGATPGWWKANDDAYPTAVYASEGTSVIDGARWGGEASVFDNDADARWIAMMHPDVGELIADWLESAARTWEFVTYSNRDAALAVAHAVLDSRDS
jgi:hypothetical protein